MKARIPLTPRTGGGPDGLMPPSSQKKIALCTPPGRTLTIYKLRELIWGGHLQVVVLPGGKKQWVDRKDIDKFIHEHKVSKRVRA